MKVKLIADSKHGPIGKVLTQEDAWRLCFPVKGCVAKCVDSEAVAAALAEIEKASGITKSRLIASMQTAGTVPDEADIEKPKPVEKPKAKVTEIAPPKSYKADHAPASTPIGPAAIPSGPVESSKGS